MLYRGIFHLKIAMRAYVLMLMVPKSTNLSQGMKSKQSYYFRGRPAHNFAAVSFTLAARTRRTAGGTQEYVLALRVSLYAFRDGLFIQISIHIQNTCDFSFVCFCMCIPIILFPKLFFVFFKSFVLIGPNYWVCLVYDVIRSTGSLFGVSIVVDVVI